MQPVEVDPAGKAGAVKATLVISSLLMPLNKRPYRKPPSLPGIAGHHYRSLTRDKLKATAHANSVLAWHTLA